MVFYLVNQKFLLKILIEENALPKIITKHIKKESHHQNIYVFDRGLQSARTLADFQNQQPLTFIGRSKENRKYIELELFEKSTGNVIKDCKVQLYRNIPKISKKGTKYYREGLEETPFRLVIWKDQQEKEYWFLSNNFELTATEISQNYRKRWVIEVFFSFSQTRLSHLVSLNKNGIQVMLYMTLITAMLLLIYEKVNEIGYRTAKRRFKMELRNLAIAIIIIQCGGDSARFFRT